MPTPKAVNPITRLTRPPTLILKRRYSLAIGKDDRLRAGERVVLVAVLPGLLDGLPDEDQRAITAVVGKPVKFLGYDDIGRAELEFDDPFDDSSHTIWVKPEFIRSIEVDGDRRDGEVPEG